MDTHTGVQRIIGPLLIGTGVRPAHPAGVRDVLNPGVTWLWSCRQCAVVI